MTEERAEAAPSRLYLSVVALVAAALVAVAMPSYQARVTVSGSSYDVPLGSTVSDLVRMGAIDPLPGDLLDVTGEVLKHGSGEPPVYLVNGEVTGGSSRMRDGDSVSVRRGKDRVEATVTTQTPIPIELEKVGKGPLVSLESPGNVGVREDTVGEISGKVLSTRVVTPAEPMTVRRWVPDPSTKIVALTFDDGPWPAQTEQVLDILAQNDVKASFFMVGHQVEKYPTIAKRAADEGHMVGNHTQNHIILTRQDSEVTRKQITDGSLTIRDKTGVLPRWFRPPGGGMNMSVVSEAKRMKMDVAMWDVDPQDWRKPSTDAMLADVLAHVKPGAVVLMHDGGGDRSHTIAVLPRLIKELKAQGYIFVTLDQMRS
ncbi:MAG: polysaccharide deacetylase family protein [Coriobacteriia bacterium]|nr:polysaccharide deacetylase family protein [Coriobacteriia bacterium]